MKLGDPIRLPEVNIRTALAVVALLIAVFDVVLLFKLGAAAFTAHAMSTQEVQARQLQLKAEDLEVQPMRGLEGKLAASARQADAFYADRLPSKYSAVTQELGKLAQDSSVTLARVGYAPKAAGSGLTQLRMDCSLTGDYQPMMRFINAMERDKLFFVIRGIGLSGQQGGLVNLRLTTDTYLRQSSPEDIAADAKADTANAGAADTSAAPAATEEQP